jgi:hypothetical protein
MTVYDIIQICLEESTKTTKNLNVFEIRVENWTQGLSDMRQDF